MNVRWSDGGSFAVIPHWVLVAEVDEKPISDKAVRLFAVLASQAQTPEQGKQLSQRWLASQMGCATSSVRAAAGELVRVGALTIETAQLENGAKAENVYVLHASPVVTVPPTPADPAADPPAGTSADNAGAIPAGGEEPSAEDLHPPVAPPSNLVVEAWRAHAPPLIAHRDSYLRDAATRRAVERALARYPAEVVAEAVVNYAAVLGGAEYRWSHSWPLVDFLKRGLDRFVAEARPLENFRDRGERFGRRDVSSREFLDAAERLRARREAEEAEGRALDP